MAFPQVIVFMTYLIFVLFNERLASAYERLVSSKVVHLALN